MLEILSRVQFAFTVGFHYLFVPVTIGLIVPAAIFETIWFKNRNPLYKSMSDFWSEIFIISYVVGIVTGLTMPIQFGTNWSKYAVFMGDVFGSPLAFEALLAFFLESTFAGIWIFKRNKISPALRLVTIWLIVLGTSISAVWILTAGSFMQHPVGFKLADDGSKVLLTSFSDLLTNPYLFWMFIHNHTAALLLGATIIFGVSAYHLKRRNMAEGFKKSINVALIIALICAVSLPIIGDLYGRYIATVQPVKAAMIQGQVQVAANDQLVVDANAGASLDPDALSLPGIANPGLIRGAFLVMVVAGFIILAATLLILVRRKFLTETRWFQNLIPWMVPLAWIAIIAGWMVTEMGRQPWIVYNLMRVSNAISDVPVAAVAFSLFLLVALYAILGFIFIKLSFQVIKKGPQKVEEGQNV